MTAPGQQLARWSVISSCFGFMGIFWIVGLVLAIMAIRRSGGSFGWTALHFNLGVLVLVTVMVVMATRG